MFMRVLFFRAFYEIAQTFDENFIHRKRKYICYWWISRTNAITVHTHTHTHGDSYFLSGSFSLFSFLFNLITSCDNNNITIV